MSYTLRGRLESRLAPALLPFAAALVLAPLLHVWWPIELVALMVGVGVLLDVAVYHRRLPYQPGWAALPLGVLELGATMGLSLLLGLNAPLTPALALFGAGWLLAQVLGHAALPFLRLTYAEDGGELGRAGIALSTLAAAAVLVVGGTAWTIRPPTIHLAAGVHQGPLVLDRPQRLVGEPGAVVRGGIVVTSDDVHVRNLTVFGGEHGIEVRDSESVVLERVRIGGATMDGVSARRSSVRISDCRIDSPRTPGAQGIDISFAMTLPPSKVERCRVRGGAEGIVSHLATVVIRDNEVSGTSLRGIAVTEMSMGEVDENRVRDAVGVAIFCSDYSHCLITDNAVSGTTPDPSGNPTRNGFGILTYFGAVATVGGNDTTVAAFIDGRFEPR
ncbi:MAG: right-handed parallel beta-helix repeat-containing protein [Gaiellaceae bacterium]